MTDSTLSFAQTLIGLPSISPRDEGCQALIAARLSDLGFKVESMPFEDVTNLWAVHGSGEPTFVFAGHTDVVPTGPVHDWDSPPFSPTVKDGYLYGRGAADMKGSLAAMITAVAAFLDGNAEHAGTIGFLITSDEEADAVNGTVKVMQALETRGTKINWCLVGEPSSTNTVGDVIRIGRRGSLNGLLTVNGIQGHIAYPDLAKNPIHKSFPALQEFVARRWDAGNEFFPATSLQISNIHAGTGANNVIPGGLEVTFNFRYSSESSDISLKQQVHEIFDRHSLDYEIAWRLSGLPFLTTETTLINAVKRSIESVTGSSPELSTSGGTSDGRFIVPSGAEVVELGPCNNTIHKVNECVKVADLDTLARIYQDILRCLMTD